MKVKKGVDITRLRDEMRWALFVVDKTYFYCGADMVVTSTYEGSHKDGSLHYKNRAVDVDLPGVYGGDILWEVKVFLGPDYDVVSESDHLHIEHDPK